MYTLYKAGGNVAELQALAKERAGHVTAATNLERQYEWIEEESQ